MRKLLTILATMAAAGPAMAATNLVTNGGFESGNTGFTSTYTYVAPGGSMVPEATYSVGQNAASYHPSWASITAIEGRNYFIANGSSVDNAPAWSQTLTGLTVGQSYQFSAFAVNVCCNSTFGGPNASPFIVTVGTGTSAGTNPIATSGSLGSTGTWTQFTGQFTANATSTALSIYTDINALSGNDYWLDAISVAAVPEPAMWGMMIAGFGMAGAAMRRRRQTKIVLA